MERIATATASTLSDIRLEQQRQACDLQQQISDCCCRLEQRISEVETRRIRDDLNQARTELTLMRASRPGQSVV